MGASCIRSNTAGLFQYRSSVCALSLPQRSTTIVVPVLSEVHAIPWSIIDPKFLHTASYAMAIAEVPHADSIQSHPYFRACPVIA